MAEKSCSGWEKSCHDMEKSGKIPEKKIQWSQVASSAFNSASNENKTFHRRK